MLALSSAQFEPRNRQGTLFILDTPKLNP